MVDAERGCPHGHGLLESETLGARVEVDRCASCGGYWFDEGELGALLETATDVRFRDPDALPVAATTAHLCPVDGGVCLVRVPYVEGGRAAVLRCPYCRGVWVEAETLSALRRLTLRALGAPKDEPEAGQRYIDPDRPMCAPLSLRAVALGVPTALLASLVWRWFFLSRYVPGGVRVPLHELGHATVSWACGRFAVPLPIGLTLGTTGRSLVVIVALPLVLAAGAGWAAVRRRWGGSAGLAMALLAHLAMCWGATTARHEQWVLLGGCGGEFAFATLLVALFHVRLSARWRWDLARWLALPVGAFVLVDATLFWRAARADSDVFPWGGAFNTDGDMARLHDEFGWSENALTGFYLHAGALAFATLAMVWLVAVVDAWRRSAARR